MSFGPSRQLKKAARVILVGAPGVGKGTQTERLLDKFPQLASISSGDLLRENVRNKTQLGMSRAAYGQHGLSNHLRSRPQGRIRHTIRKPSPRLNNPRSHLLRVPNKRMAPTGRVTLAFPHDILLRFLYPRRLPSYRGSSCKPRCSCASELCRPPPYTPVGDPLPHRVALGPRAVGQSIQHDLPPPQSTI